MRDSFTCEKFQLDLSKVHTSYMEENPRFKDSFFTKYSLPFEFYLDEDLRLKIGNYSSLKASGLAKKYEGWHCFEGKLKKGVLEILEVEGDLVKAQLDSGFEEFPNFNKKLNELPFSDISVDNIYTHANEVIEKKFPQVVYNFPRVIYKKHESNEPGWERFNKFLNDRAAGKFIDNNEDGSDWEELPEDERTNDDKYRKNRNIIHPMPYLLHVLELGFAAEGYVLKGDILSDNDLLQRVIFSNSANYFEEKQSESFSAMAKATEGIDFLEEGFGFWRWNATMEIPKGDFILQGFIYISAKYHPTVFPYNRYSKVKIKVNGTSIFNEEYPRDKVVEPFIQFSNSETEGVLEIEVDRWVNDDDIQNNNDIFSLRVDSLENVNDSGEKIPLFSNKNNFNIKDFVPDITFGELVKTIKNWKNYDIEINGNDIIMNRLNKNSVVEMIDFNHYEVAVPIKKLTTKRSYNIVFPEIGDKKQSVFIDDNGPVINGTSKESTSEVKVNGYCMPVETYRGRTTVTPKTESDNILSLAYYDGLHNGDNYAQNPAGLMLPEILSTWEDWYKMRIDNNEITWSFYANKNQLRNVGIRSTLYAYGQRLWIKSINKTVISRDTYHVEIVAETIH